MTYQTPTEAGINLSQGADQLLVYISSQVPIFIPMFLLSFFVIVSLGGYFSQKRTTGVSNFPLWFAVGGYLTTGVSIILSLTAGIINLQTMIIVIVVAIIGTVWFLTSGRD